MEKDKQVSHNSNKILVGTNSTSNIRQSVSNFNNQNSQDKNNIPAMINSLSKPTGQNNLKNLYQSIGTRVSKLREINETYEKKISSQTLDLKNLDKKIADKQKILNEIRFHKGNLARGFSEKQLEDINIKDEKKFYNEEKIKESTKQSEEYFNQLYNEMIANKEFSMKINSNHIQNDPGLRKIYIEKERELAELQNKLNSIVKKTEVVKKDIDALRLENHKNNTNLKDLLEKKKLQTKEMDRISEEANRYLKDKENINNELVELNEKIDNQKITYENKMKELNKMIDNTKKIKEFHETLAIEKFSKTSNYFKKNNITSDNENKKSVNIIQEESMILEELNNQLKSKRKVTAYLNLNKLILVKKQSQLKDVIHKVKTQTGIENLDKLSEYLELSSKTNNLFETDLQNLNLQKDEIEQKIAKMKEEIENTQAKVNDTSTKKFDYIKSLKEELAQEEKNKENFNRKLYTLNRMIDIIAKGFKEVCLKLNYGEELQKSDLDSSESVLTKCMDLLERKIVEIIQLNQDPLRENNLDVILNNEENKNKLSIIEKALDNMFLEESNKNIYENKSNLNISASEILTNAKEMVNSFMKRYEKLSL